MVLVVVSITVADITLRLPFTVFLALHGCLTKRQLLEIKFELNNFIYDERFYTGLEFEFRTTTRIKKNNF